MVVENMLYKDADTHTIELADAQDEAWKGLKLWRDVMRRVNYGKSIGSIIDFYV